MRYSLLFGKTKRDAPADADSVNAALLSQGGFVDKQMAGVYNFLPLGLRVLRKIQQIVREEMDAIGGNEILMPAITQVESYEKTGRDKLDILFHTMGHNDSRYVLNQSHEEVVTPLVQRFSFSYRDFPMSVYQLQNKFRNEPRARSGVLRGREFNMKDMYSFHTTEEDLNEYYERAKEAYFKVYKRLGLGDITVIAYASGGSFSKYSHEFQTLCDIGEDTVHLCEKCRIGINKEIIEEQKNCPGCGSSDLVAKKSIEVGNIFKLRTRFTDAFGFTYADEKGQQQKVEMGCYGIGPSRLMGTLVEVFHDDKGIIWPESVAPYQFHLALLGNQPEVKEAAEDLYNKMREKGAEILFDDRDESIGAKLANADLIGIPTRLVVSKKSLENGGVEVKSRSSKDSKIISINELMQNC